MPDIIVYNRLLDAADFGHSENEKKYWEPGKRTIKSSVFQNGTIFRCAEISGKKRGLVFGDHLKVIASAYSYPLLRYHRDKGVKEFINYGNFSKKDRLWRNIFLYLSGIVNIFKCKLFS